MYNHNKAQQSKNRVHISWDILYMLTCLGYRVFASIEGQKLHHEWIFSPYNKLEDIPKLYNWFKFSIYAAWPNENIVSGFGISIDSWVHAL